MTFFDYSEKVKPADEFGIRDDEKGKEERRNLELSNNPESPILSIPIKELPAFIDYNNKKEWNAVVQSDNRNDFNFIAVDNNIPYNDKDGNENSRCDSIIYTEQTIVFIELKNQEKKWFEESINQLKMTIDHFDKTDGLNKFKFKKAYACNKIHPYFNYQFKNRIQQFFRETGVSLHPEMIIKNVR